MTLLAPFEVQKDKDIQDFNYEVDALEDEHIRREVHTTKRVKDDESESGIKQEYSDISYTELSAKNNNKRIKKAKGREPPKVFPPTDDTMKHEDKPKFPSLLVKREAKKSFDFLNNDDHSDNNSESRYPSIPKFSQELGTASNLQKEIKNKPLLFSQIGSRVNKDIKEEKDNTR